MELNEFALDRNVSPPKEIAVGEVGTCREKFRWCSLFDVDGVASISGAHVSDWNSNIALVSIAVLKKRGGGVCYFIKLTAMLKDIGGARSLFVGVAI